MDVTHNTLKETAAAQAQRQSKPVEVSNSLTSKSSTSNLNDAVSKVQSQTLTDDIYTKAEHIPKVTYDRPLEFTTVLADDPELLDKMTNTISHGELPARVKQIQPIYQDFMLELRTNSPTLAQKDWGFSVDENDKLVVSGDITEDERIYLEEKLNENEDLVRLAKDIPDILIKGMEYDRGNDGKGQYYGKYDVTVENFKDIIDVKELLDASATYISTGLLHFNPDYQDNLGAQLAWRAEVKYAY
ncbi:hypothetical protein GCM10008107_00330 [Psychrosphaera saromensis]|uniref:Uncharacterized protein n=1 Tax=Psychrosphaera saromensis TaxID=716813 RepID=A0A2S7UYX4_9GAMM|nr:hypothetical protein [Psychrosphaera saromensis]PQJ54989.1 hypothetical protein BTO11_15885 [Psychrosphaera saromensis]GHB55562.1 hypothetical protein GCM10008107_00330 [Psychrosphaera saromensis]GLQ13755.1 hypothetical protein GCM10007917_12100 [Psychrosphaera saromensis]